MTTSWVSYNVRMINWSLEEIGEPIPQPPNQIMSCGDCEEMWDQKDPCEMFDSMDCDRVYLVGVLNTFSYSCVLV